MDQSRIQLAAMHEIRLPLIEHIVYELTEPQGTIIKKQINSLINENSTCGKSSATINLNGKIYAPHSSEPLFTEAHLVIAPQFRLHFSLYEQAHEVSIGIKRLELDRRQITQGLTVMSSFCKTDQDFRDALPEACVKSIASYSAIPRTREEAWCYADKPLRLTEWQNTRDLITVHLANRMLT